MKPEAIETYFAISLIFIFILWEKFRPHSAIDHKAQWKLDLLGFIAIFFFGKISRLLLNELGQVGAPSFAQALSSLYNTWESLPSLLRVILGITLVDFFLYWIHRFMHLPLFWRFHSWHHSAEQLYWFSGFRASLFHTFLFLAPQILLIHLLGLTALETGAALCFGVFIQFWQHANIQFSLGPLDKILMTPTYHRIHHARDNFRDTNFGTVYVIWDRLFGTYVDPSPVPTEKLPLGISKKPPVWRMVMGL